MGTLRSESNWSGRDVGGTTLGHPVVLADGLFLWDGSVPTGLVDASGAIVAAAVGRIVAPELAPTAPPVTSSERKAGVTSVRIVADKVEYLDGRDVKIDDATLDVKYDEIAEWVKPAEPAASVRP